MLHYTEGHYSNGSKKINGVKSENIASHIWYNITCRPGRALFVDGYCLHKGSLSEDRITEILRNRKDEKATEDTAPYQ